MIEEFLILLTGLLVGIVFVYSISNIFINKMVKKELKKLEKDLSLNIKRIRGY